MMPKCPDGPWKFEMYVIGDNSRSALAIDNLRGICKDYLDKRCQITIIDLKKDPGKMAEKKICATPTLIRTYPGPERMLIGDLSKTDVVLEGLDLGRRERKGNRGMYSHGLSKQGLSSKWNHTQH